MRTAHADGAFLLGRGYEVSLILVKAVWGPPVRDLRLWRLYLPRQRTAGQRREAGAQFVARVERAW
jgi:hypothetical protein